MYSTNFVVMMMFNLQMQENKSKSSLFKDYTWWVLETKQLSQTTWWWLMGAHYIISRWK